LSRPFFFSRRRFDGSAQTDWRSHKRRRSSISHRSFNAYIWHEPGAPPHRPHIGAASFAADFPDPSPPTAKTLSAFNVCVEPHSGHAGFTSDDIDRTSSSNRFLHF